MKDEKKSIEFIKNPSELTKEDLINIKGGASSLGCICKCGTNSASMQKQSEGVQAQ
jgi:hypothetical protein